MLQKHITKYKNTTDWRTSTTMGAIASCLLQGMPPSREDFNNGKCCIEWLTTSIARVLEDDTTVEPTDEELAEVGVSL